MPVSSRVPSRSKMTSLTAATIQQTIYVCTTETLQLSTAPVQADRRSVARVGESWMPKRVTERSRWLPSVAFDAILCKPCHSSEQCIAMTAKELASLVTRHARNAQRVCHACVSCVFACRYLATQFSDTRLRSSLGPVQEAVTVCPRSGYADDRSAEAVRTEAKPVYGQDRREDAPRWHRDVRALRLARLRALR